MVVAQSATISRRAARGSKLRGVWLAPLSVMLAMLAVPGSPARAASLGVSPTLIDMSATQMASGVRVRNGNPTDAVNVQARIFRWHQDVEQETYAPTDAVVVSPPVIRIEPGAERLIRIVRTGQQAVHGEDSYRLLLDELPEPGQVQTGGITMRIRQSIPVFVSHAQATPAQAQWQIERVNEHIRSPAAGGTGKNDNAHRRPVRTGYLVKVTNRGDKRLRVANLALHDATLPI